MSEFKHYLSKSSELTESSDKIETILNRTKVAIQKLESKEPFDPIIEAFILFSEQYSSYKSALAELDNLGTFAFQNSARDEYDEDDSDFDGVTWGDLADLTVSEVTHYVKARSKGFSKLTIDSVIKQLNKITW